VEEAAERIVTNHGATISDSFMDFVD
jgi:hypothetical protein